jgi:putative lipoic acid-binding regulatory protein
MQDSDFDGLRKQLDEHHDWPSEYMFKFIAPNLADQVEAVLSVFPTDVRVDRRESGGGKYIALTIREVMDNAEGVFDRYRAVHAIGGIFAL